MKNCPMFSLRSNSIESRFRSIRRGNFGSDFRDFKKGKSKIKSKVGIRSAHQFLCSLRSVYKQIKFVRTHSGCSVLTVENRKGACNQGKSEGEIFMMLNRS